MKVRKLKKEEHIRTRKLWETVFREDSGQFLDYYYSVKIAENEIYVIEDGDEIISMIHLNPYQMRVGDKIYQTHYIVAVATDEGYRRRGLMAKLLNHTLRIMADRGEPFTFLMPASEEIYKPFGFAFVYGQNRCSMTGKCDIDATMTFTFAKEADCKEIADFANRVLGVYDVVTWRTEEYYKMVLQEQVSEEGGILLAKKDGKIEGVFCYAQEEGIEIREPLFCDEEVLKYAIYQLTGNEAEEVLCVGYGNTESKPMIMAKVLDEKFGIHLEKAKIFLNEVV